MHIRPRQSWGGEVGCVFEIKNLCSNLALEEGEGCLFEGSVISSKHGIYTIIHTEKMSF